MWIYIVSQKFDFFPIFVKFKCLVENLFQCKILIPQSNRRIEYQSHFLSKFLETHGIKHELSGPHTPGQNGIAKRKHQHILNLNRALLIHSNVPHEFLPRTFHIVVYLIKRLPSFTLNFQ